MGTGRRLLRGIALIVPLGYVVLAPWRLDGVTQVAQATEHESDCSAGITQVLVPSSIRTCDTCTVGLGVIPHCLGEPLNVVLVLLGYANPTVPEEQLDNTWTRATIDALSLSQNSNISVGVVYVRKQAKVVLQLSNDDDRVRGASHVQRVNVGSQSGDWPCFSCGFSKAAEVLRNTDRRHNVIVYLGGMIDFPLIAADDDTYYRDWVRGAQTAKAAASVFVVGCPWITNCKGFSHFPWYREASPGYFFDGPGAGRIADAMEGLVNDSTSTKIDALQIDEPIPDTLDYLPDSASTSRSQFDPTTKRIRWSFTAPITSGVPITLTYRVQPRANITTPVTTTFTGGQVVLTDTAHLSRILPIPTSVLTITGPCEPIVTSTPTPTDTPPPTATDVAPSPTATSTRTPTATATPLPGPVYLPIGLREEPCTREQRADVVLVMDASTSMNEPAGDGRTKLDAARAAAAAFVGRLKLDAGDQAAVVAFNADARLVVGLTSDATALSTAFGSIVTASQTCLVCGLEVASTELTSARHRPDNEAVVILLTDGRSNPRPASEAVAEAGRMKADGVVVFTIGLGADLDDAALTAIASKPGFAHRAADGAALEAIYRQIAVTLPGAGDCYWGRRP